MNLQYRVIVVAVDGERYEAHAGAFPGLRVTGETPREAVDAAQREIARVLGEYARDGRPAPPPDPEAAAIELVTVPFEARGAHHANVHVEVITGCVYRDGAEVPVRGSTLALLMILATETRAVPVETLSERLYPGIPSDQAYDALKMCVYRARKQLGGRGVIETSERGYRLAEGVVVDMRFLAQIVRAIRSRSLAKAIEARLDAIFEQLIAGRPAAYSAWDWFAPVERQLRSAAREVGLYVAERALRDRDSVRALEIAQRLALLDPLDEKAHELAIRVHLSRGDRASALRAFRRYAADLQAQHGMEPSPALRALME